MAGIFDGLMKGLSSFMPADDPSTKIFQTQNELKEIEQKENDLYAKLGRQVFAAGGSARYPEYGVQLEALAANKLTAQQALKQLNDEKAAKEQEEAEQEAKKQAEEAGRTCSACGHINPENTKFCQECGAKLKLAQSCPVCGAKLEPGVRFCGECGARI